MESENQPSHILIPRERLSPEAFDALLEEYILREGTDYGSVELTLEAKKARAIRQLESGFVKIVYSPEHESCTIIKTSKLGTI